MCETCSYLQLGPRVDTLALLVAYRLSCFQLPHDIGVLHGLPVLTGVVDPSLPLPMSPHCPGTVTILGYVLRWT